MKKKSVKFSRLGNTGKKGKTPGKVYPTSDLAMRHPNNYCLEILD